MHIIQRLARDKRAATAIEYGLIAGLIFLAIVGSVRLLSDNTVNLFTRVGNAWSNSGGA